MFYRKMNKISLHNKRRNFDTVNMKVVHLIRQNLMSSVKIFKILRNMPLFFSRIVNPPSTPINFSITIPTIVRFLAPHRKYLSNTHHTYRSKSSQSRWHKSSYSLRKHMLFGHVVFWLHPWSRFYPILRMLI